MTKLKNIAKLAMIPVVAFGLNGCDKKYNSNFCKMEDYGTYNVTAGLNETKRYLIIEDHPSNVLIPWGSTIMASTMKGDSSRFDKIDLIYPDNKHLERYGKFDSLEKIFNYVKENGCDCEEDSEKDKQKRENLGMVVGDIFKKYENIKRE